MSVDTGWFLIFLFAGDTGAERWHIGAYCKAYCYFLTALTCLFYCKRSPISFAQSPKPGSSGREVSRPRFCKIGQH